MGSCCPGNKSSVAPENKDSDGSERSPETWIYSDNIDSKDVVLGDIRTVYTLGMQLGQPGQFGIAYECTKKSENVTYAVKKIEKTRFLDASVGCTQSDRLLYYEQFRDEITLMKEMDHPNIVKLIEVFEDAESLWLVMEKCDGGELFDRIKAKHTYTEKDAASVLRQFAQGIEAMHKKRVAHCDLKPDNILFLTTDDDAPLKIIDFGMSKHCDNQTITGFRGTPYYVAPEIVNQKEYKFHCDMWSFGVISFVMLYGFPPFHSRSGDDEEIYTRIKEGFCPEIKDGFGPWFPSSTEITDSARDVISRCLEMDPVKRYTATEVLEHPWVTGQAASGKPLVPQVLKNLNEFTSGCKLKAAVLDLMTDILTDVEIQNLQETFAAIDKNRDGQITAEELREAVSKQASMEEKGEANDIHIKNFETIIEMADTDGDGKLSYKELLATCVQRKMKLKEERMDAAFKKFDVDGDGKISKSEVKKILAASGKVVSDEVAKQIIDEVDTDKDGEIDQKEFLAMWNRTQSAVYTFATK